MCVRFLSGRAGARIPPSTGNGFRVIPDSEFRAGGAGLPESSYVFLKKIWHFLTGPGKQK